jgi:hypothetical protein
MRNTRYIFITILLCVAAFGLIMNASCKKNDCGNTSCKNGGVCVHDTCECATGYLGNDCGTTWSTQFLGTYTCVQSCSPSSGNANWTSNIAGNANSGQDTVTITNFGGNNKTVTAGVDYNGNIYLLAGPNGGLVGQGKFVNNILSITYTTTSGGYICTATMTKQ